MSQWDVLCGCMFLLSLIATYQVCTVSLKAGLYTYKAVEPTAYSFGSAALRLRFRRRLTASVRLHQRRSGPYVDSGHQVNLRSSPCVSRPSGSS